MLRHRLVWATTLSLVLAGCHGHRQYRSSASLCEPNAEDCGSSALIRLNEAAVDTYLGFAEFDDQGAYWDRALALDVLDRLEREVEDNSAIFLVFAHGWKHNAKASDRHLDSVRGILQGLANFEACFAQEYQTRPRSVVGLYLGWRGGTWRPPLLRELTFWGRKRVAHKIGESAMQDWMLRVERLYLDKRSRETAVQARTAEAQQRSYLLSVGHSFGGALLFSALNPMLLERAYDETRLPGRGRLGFGDLVVLINPAFEARRFTELAELAIEHQFAKAGPPVLATFSSEADWATRYAFPIGRWLGTVWQRYGGEPEQRLKNINTLGHYRPYITHRLGNQPISRAPCVINPDSMPDADRRDAVSDVQQMRNQLEDAGQDESLGAPLEPIAGSRLPNDGPYIVVEVDRAYIDGHNDFANEKFQQFLIEFLTANALSPRYAK